MKKGKHVRQPSFVEGLAFGYDEEDIKNHFEERAQARRRFNAEAAMLTNPEVYPRAVLTKEQKAARDKAQRPALLFPTLRHYDIKNIPHDLLVGLIVAALSLPISIGYAQVAGLPAVYGLYGSIIPMIVYAMFSTSPQLVFGVDAAPAALAASAVVGCGLVVGSDEGVALIPWLTLFTGILVLVFSFLKLGKFVNFISAPVMGGFVSGIALSIILGQLPKLMGGTPTGGEMHEHIMGLIGTFQAGINSVSLVLGIVTIVVILTARHYAPRLPMPIIMLVLGGVATVVLDLPQYGVALLGAVPAGLPEFHMLEFPGFELLGQAALGSLSIALIVSAESLLVDNSFAMKGNYKIDDNRELLAFGLSNLSSCALGMCPVSGSASRTAASEQFGGKTQLSTIIAAFLLVGVLLYATDLLAYLPIPVLTGIVICALWSVVEVDFARRLYSAQRDEFYIFILALLGVMISGPIMGVVVGLALSFVAVLLRTMNPQRSYMGVVPGKRGLFDLACTPDARPLPFTVIYRFTGNMFFANAAAAAEDIETAINERTRVVIVELAGMNNCDITAADRIAVLFRELGQRGIRMYMVGLIDRVREQLNDFGIQEINNEGILQNTVADALRDAFERGVTDHDGAAAMGGGRVDFFRSN